MPSRRKLIECAFFIGLSGINGRIKCPNFDTGCGSPVASVTLPTRDVLLATCANEAFAVRARKHRHDLPVCFILWPPFDGQFAFLGAFLHLDRNTDTAGSLQ